MATYTIGFPSSPDTATTPSSASTAAATSHSASTPYTHVGTVPATPRCPPRWSEPARRAEPAAQQLCCICGAACQAPLTRARVSLDRLRAWRLVHQHMSEAFLASRRPMPSPPSRALSTLTAFPSMRGALWSADKARYASKLTVQGLVKPSPSVEPTSGQGVQRCVTGDEAKRRHLAEQCWR